MHELAHLIRAGHVIPATLQPLRANREATADVVREACAALNIRARVTHNGPHGAVVVVESGNEWDIGPALGAGFRFRNQLHGFVVRRVLA